MGNKTIYAKNEPLWERAKSIAGKAGLSGLVEEALESLVTERELEQKGFKRFHLPIESWGDADQKKPDYTEALGFDGKLLAEKEGLLSVYRTKAGKFVVTDTHPVTSTSIYDHRIYDTIDELQNDEAIKRLDADAQVSLFDVIIGHLPPMHFTEWID